MRNFLLYLCRAVIKFLTSKEPKRPVSYTATKISVSLTKSGSAAKIFREIWDKEMLSVQEQVYLIFVNKDNKIINHMLLHTGGHSKCFIDIRLLFQYAYLYKAKGIIIGHNHPEGDLEPTIEDIEITNEIQQACKILKFKLLDHIILTPQSYFSFLEGELLAA